jgi:tRNA-(ms[2]io[6]A)-hydroxylase
MMFRYPEHNELIRVLADIVEEEMAHFKLVLALMDRRGFRFTKQKPSAYAGRLATQVRGTQGKDELVDRLLMCALIEARSCERFKLLGEHLADPELAEFYRSLFESEARHYATYLKLALALDPEPVVRARLAELVAHEAKVCAEGEPNPRLHA